MNGYEMIRLFCYTISAPLLLYLALAFMRSHRYAPATFYLSISFLFAWFVFEASLTATGTNTRDIRFFATPVVVIAAGSVMAMVAQQVDLQYKLRRWRSREWQSKSSTQQDAG